MAKKFLSGNEAFAEYEKTLNETEYDTEEEKESDFKILNTEKALWDAYRAEVEKVDKLLDGGDRKAADKLLDEIEAALDDSNVTRFAEYLHTLIQTQFIVITHRRGTMENADRLFGITMQEKGVSTLVSVDLVQDQLEA